MNASRIVKDGTWTLRVADRGGSVWTVVLDRLWIIDRRFQRARFVLVGGPTVLISAADLDKAIDSSVPPAKMQCPLEIDPEKETINGQSVEMQSEV